MEGANEQQPERLEDQLRRMIVNGGPSSPASQDGHRSSAAQHAPAGHPSQRPHDGNIPHQHGSQQNHPGNRFPQNTPSPGPNMRPYGMPNWRQRNAQRRDELGHQGYQQHFNNQQRQPNMPVAPNQRARYQQQMPLDPNAFQRGGFGPPHMRQSPGSQQLFNPNQPRPLPVASLGEQHARQVQYLEQVGATEVRSVEMSQAERDDKESFRIALDTICHEICQANPGRIPKVSLECFGSFKSGFASAGSDMDLVIVVKDGSSSSACFSLLEDDLPRALEKQLLQLGYGARLLTRTRVPIIKVCEKPDAGFLVKLREEREKWDVLPNEKKYPHLHAGEDEADVNGHEQPVEGLENGAPVESKPDLRSNPKAQVPGDSAATVARAQGTNGVDHTSDPTAAPSEQAIAVANAQRHQRADDKPWTRERKAGPLDFPKTGVGIQSDINFFNPLGLHNTQMLRCYSLCDPRVRSMMLFVKAWVKRRKINSSYSGTLSSYGYVLMVLHYLVNIAHPPVLPNLQSTWRPHGNYTQARTTGYVVDGWNVNFWGNEEEILAAVRQGQLTANRESLGALLAGFFHYYSSQGGGVTFRWMQEVLSLRSIGGLLTKEEKGWVKAVTEEGEGKKIQHRYLFCIEDPFELTHNVARTVTHKGIVAIRDEFRRAKRILLAVGNGQPPVDGELFSQLVEAEDFRKASEQLKATDAQNGAQNGAIDGVVESPLPKPRVVLAKPKQQVQMSNHQAHAMNQQGHAATPPSKKAPLPKPKQPKQLNVQDNDAFPTLAAQPKLKKKQAVRARESSAREPGEEYGEISGATAKAYLEEVKRKRDEAQAESTAMGAAEAVLADFD